MNDLDVETRSLVMDFRQSVGDIDARQWNSLDGAGQVFTRHEFLSALETSGCVCPDTGWLPQHITISDPDGTLLAAAPAYLKSHSYGEYVFDWAWADAYQRAGLSYYPKFISCIPFTPVTGPRILTRRGYERLAPALVEAGLDHARTLNSSSFHWIFTTERDQATLSGCGLFERLGNQFHWTNQGYASFDDFLASLSSKKRKQIRRERKRVLDAGVEVSVRPARDTTDEDWDTFFRCYNNTVSLHGAIRYLSRSFFSCIARALPDNTLLVQARRGGRVIASGLLFQDQSGLYGRYWGALEYLPDLHFEVCYYAPIVHCIENCIDRFEAGAQGSHKLARGLLPCATWSSHWLNHPRFARAIEDYVENEKQGMEQYMDDMSLHSPFRKPGS